MNTSLRVKITVGTLLAAGLLAAGFAANADIKLNSVGFLPNAPKFASITVLARDSLAPAPTFTIWDAASHRVVFSGTAGRVIANTDTRDFVRVADFSEFTTPGRYYFQATNIGQTPPFDIGGDVFVEPYRAMMLGMYLWRCGTAVDATYNGVRYHHEACHTSDAHVCHTSGAEEICVGGEGGVRDATGGWHDAGDYNKYVVNSGVTVGLMLKAWEHFASELENIDLMAISKDGNIPEYLAEVKWNLDWVAKMQYDDGKVSHKLSAINFCSMTTLPERETAPRYFAQWSTAATGAFTAMLAQAARVYAPYAPETAAKWLEQAKTSYELLRSSPFVRETQAPFRTGEYGASHDHAQRLWAAAELWETTGDGQYLRDFEERAGVIALSGRLEWGNVSALAMITYASSSRPGRSAARVNTVETRLVSVANGFVNAVRDHGYGRVFDTENYYWGSHGALTATTYILNSAYMLTGDERFRSAGHEVISHIFGRNYYGRSFVTGVGRNPPQHPHDRRSEATGKPWPGYLIGGPHNQKSGALEPYNCEISAACWVDSAGDYATNEIAINWNASMIYALAGYLSPGNPAMLTPGETVAAIRNANAPGRTARAPRITRMINIRNGRPSAAIPQGARVYSLDGRLVAHRRHGDTNVPVIKRNGMFIMKVERAVD